MRIDAARLLPWLLGTVALATGCTRDQPAPRPAPVPPPASPLAPAQVPPAVPAGVPSPWTAILATDAGPDLLLAGPELPADGAEPDAWTLAASPRSLRFVASSAQNLEVSVLDARGQPWPTRVRLHKRGAEVELLRPLTPGSTYRLVARADEDAAWDQPLEVSP